MGRMQGWVGLTCAVLAAGCATTEDVPTDAGNGDSGPTDSGMPGALVPVDIQGEVLLANGYPGQILPLFRSEIGSGSALGRVELFARFCSDAACATPLAVVPLVIDGADANGRYVLASASTVGEGFAKPFTITQAPLGASFVQIIGDTEFSVTAGLGECSTTANCPADFDVISIDGFQVGQNVDGTTAQPGPDTIAINVASSGASLTLADTFYLGHLAFDPGPLDDAAPPDDGTLLLAISNAADSYRNLIGTVDLSNASATPGALTTSYILQNSGSDFLGDVCGIVRGVGSAYAIGVDNTGTHIFELSATTGAQVSDDPIVTIPPTDMSDPSTYARPCRGVFGSVNGVDHLYLVQFSGAGALETSYPFPFYDVDVTNGTYTTPITDTDYALRAIAIDGTSHLFAADMSWSKDSGDNMVGFNRILELTRDSNGHVTGIASTTTTNLESDEPCGATNNWPSGAAVVTINGASALVVGHNTGVAVYNPSTLVQTSNLQLPGFGQLFAELVPSPDGNRLYALPQCKALNTATTFELPYAQTTENADTNLVAILDTTGSALAVANTTIDIDADGTNDHGIDLDYWFLKRYIRDHSSTLPIPPVVFTGPQLAVGTSMLFVRGSGIQGDGTPSQISSSGLGQVQDIGFFSLATGRGVLFGDYIPWTDGLSSEAGTGTGIWGYDVHAGQESSVGAVLYLPAP
ncbi:MAG: hypothetical protein IPG81_18880 [Sandaracinaceae bacterium]|nr:hypothetical protein [Sandaracinaceae bacterium]